MIFVTVGTQLPFDRLTALMDNWAQQSKEDVFAQVGPTKKKFYGLRTKEFLSPAEAEQCFDEADLIVAHAGMGSILSALQRSKPIIIFPRKASLGEHRNEHQMATARRFKNRFGIYVAFEEEELLGFLKDFKSLMSCDEISQFAPDEFIFKIKNLID